MTDFELKTTSDYICSLCGFPVINGDKLRVLQGFLDSQFHNIGSEELQKAFEAYAAGKLDEKLDSHKSLTGLVASRVLQSYSRSRRAEPDRPQYYTNDRGEQRERSRDL